ncbi:hypothetical protein [Desulfogranum japonicum]|uniref:hypothetical protein n=1 Tax=Desulfogranum japonicum TaxID=231447 RepID=UPI00048CA417|nr:hypothetical protein [Desulfogranum japonicum]
MEYIPLVISSIFSIIFLATLIFSFFKIKVATATAIAYLSFFPFIIGLIYIFSYPAEGVQGEIIPAIPFTIGSVLLLLFFIVLTPLLPESKNKKNTPPKNTRWILLISGYFLHIIGISITFTFWYAPETSGPAHEKISNPALSLGMCYHRQL